MASVKSELSKATIMTQQFIDEIQQLNQAKSIQMLGKIDGEVIFECWTALGAYIAKQLRVGRAVKVPKLGLFSFSAPEVTLEGTTNQEKREAENREPIFIVSKSVAKGMELKAAVFRESGLRPIVVSSTSGKIQTIQCNFSDISQISKQEKDIVSLAIDRMCNKLDSYIRQKSMLVLELPCVGTFILKGNMFGMYFNQFLQNQVKGVLRYTIEERKKRMQSQLTAKNLMELEKHNQEDQFFEIDEETKQWLEKNIGIDIDNYSSPNVQKHSQFRFNNRRTRGYKSQAIDNNSSLANQLSMPFDSVSQSKYYNESKDQKGVLSQPFSLESLSIKKIKQSLSIDIQRPEIVAQTIFGIVTKEDCRLNREQFGQAIKKLQIDFFDFEIDSLFKVIDFKKDGLIDLEEWSKIVCDQRSINQILSDELAKHQNQISNLIQGMGLALDTPQLNQDSLKQAFFNLNNQFTDREASNLTSAALGHNNQINIKDLILWMQQVTGNTGSNSLLQSHVNDGQQLTNQLQLNNLSGNSKMGKNGINLKRLERQIHQCQDWETSVYQRIKYDLLKLDNPLILQQFFENCDQRNEGLLDIANFKTCLFHCNLTSISIEDLNKFCQGLLQGDNQMIDYNKFLKKVNNSLQGQDQGEGLEFIADKIKQYMKEKRLDAKEFILHLAENKDDRQRYGIDLKSSMKPSIFGQILAGRMFPKEKAQEVIDGCQMIDVDKDGVIDQYDLDTFLKRYAFIEENMQIMRSEQVLQRNKVQEAASPTRAKLQQAQAIPSVYVQRNAMGRVFPTVPLRDDKLTAVLGDFKKALANKKISFYEAFKLLDSDNDDFVTINEFEEQMNRFLSLSKQAKYGLFAYFDQLKIGMFDLQRFVSVMNRLTLEKGSSIVDNWEWQDNVLNKWRNWFQSQNPTIDEAFRMADYDFDGFLSKEDIKHFLINTLQIQEQQIEQNKLDRLFKLMDHFKRGVIQRSDLQKTLSPKLYTMTKESNNPQYSNNKPFQTYADEINDNNISSSNRFTKNFNVGNLVEQQKKALNSSPNETILPRLNSQGDLEEIKSNSKSASIQFSSASHQQQFAEEPWLRSACQQISLTIQNNFKDLKESYEEISRHQNSLNYKHFKQWIESSLALEGFNLTDKLMQKLFAFLDPHSKGYLSLADWTRAFCNFMNKKDVELLDFKESIKFNFQNSQQAYSYFVAAFENGKGKLLGLDQFKTAIKALFNTLYSNKRIDQIWEYCLEKLGITQTPTEAVINYDQFCQVFGIKKESLYSVKSNSVSTLKSMISSSHQHSQQAQTQDQLFNKIKNAAIASGKNIAAAFDEIDKNKNGIISTIQFKHVLLKLNLGLSSREIDLAMALVCPKDPAIVNWKIFMQKIQLNETEEKLLYRSHQKIKDLCVALYEFKISPKDAFREYDQKKKGFLTFNEFSDLVIKSNSSNNSLEWTFAVIKDIFDFIDIKGDGIIDMDEWIQAFTRFDSHVAQSQNNALIQRSKSVVNYKINEKQQMQLQSPVKASNILRKSMVSFLSKPESELNYKKRKAVDFYKTISGPSLNWERTAEYDRVITVIAKNRNESQSFQDNTSTTKNSGNIQQQYDEQYVLQQQDKQYLRPDQVQKVLHKFLQQYEINLEQKNWPVLMNFAMKNGLVNYKLMLNVFKDRCIKQDQQPTLNTSN